eukprot:6469850-Prymnesium_polylepis.1
MRCEEAAAAVKAGRGRQEGGAKRAFGAMRREGGSSERMWGCGSGRLPPLLPCVRHACPIPPPSQ